MARHPVSIPVRTVLCGLCVLLCLAAPAAHAKLSSAYRQIDDSADAYLRYSLGRLMELRGMLNDALVQYRRADAIDPGQCEIETAIARVLFTLGRLEDARPRAEAALRECPESVESTALLAAIALSEENPARAESLLVAHATGEDAPVELVLLLSQSLLAQGRAGDAEELLRRRAETDSLSQRVVYHHARVLLELGRREEAAETLLRANELDGANAAVVELATGLLASLGREEEAVSILESFVDGREASERHSVALARAYGQLGDNARALEVTRAGLTRFGETQDLLGALGSILFDMGRIDESLEAYERVLEIEPSSVQALNFIAYTLADLDIDSERAVVLASRAVELSPESGIIRDTLGWAYFRAGRVDEAVLELGKAVELGETDPVILEHLGDALEAAGRIEEAIAAWQRALEEEPERGSARDKIARARAGVADTALEEEGAN
ncbi:MAG: tetratricopeptide repeat protein [Candidatus Eisenbacteria bacterium]